MKYWPYTWCREVSTDVFVWDSVVNLCIAEFLTLFSEGLTVTSAVQSSVTARQGFMVAFTLLEETFTRLKQERTWIRVNTLATEILKLRPFNIFCASQSFC